MSDTRTDSSQNAPATLTLKGAEPTVFTAGYRAGAEAMRWACIAVAKAQIQDLATNYPVAWISEFAANTCRAVILAIEALDAYTAPDIASHSQVETE